MSEHQEKRVTVFWSWQDDSPATLNRNFIEDALQRAVKGVAKTEEVVIAVDRDTKGVGGTPSIADTILSKIQLADLFVCDVTLAYEVPRPAPNPNVMFELGYALALLGEGRIIAVMNTGGYPGGDSLPFDLRHRRWPIQYELAADVSGEQKQTVRAQLVKDLENAVRLALAEPRTGAARPDVDFLAARGLWSLIDSEAIQAWNDWTSTYPQWQHREWIDRFEGYLAASRRPENEFVNASLSQTHADLRRAIRLFLGTSAQEMIPDHIGDRYVISVKASDRHIENYDEMYDRQVDAIEAARSGVWSAWREYVRELRSWYPEIVAGEGGSSS